MTPALKEAIEFASFFKKERNVHLYKLSDVATMSGINRDLLSRFEKMRMEEKHFLKYHLKLSHWLSSTNFQRIKIRRRKYWKKEEEEYLNQCWDGEKMPSKEVMQNLVDKMGVSKGSIYSWFRRQKTKKTAIES